MNMQDEIDRYWNTYYEDSGWKLDPRSEFRGIRNTISERSAVGASEHYERWKSILDFGIEWLSYVHLALSKNGDAGPRNKKSRAVWALTGAATNFACSVRDTCIAGHETPSKALLRTLTETLYLCVAILYDEKLGLEYTQAQDDKKVKNFWHTSASPRNLHLKIIEIEKQFGLPQETIDVFTKYRMSDYEVMSQATHLSYELACQTCLPEPIERAGVVAVGILGVASNQAIISLSKAARTIWYFSRLSYPRIMTLDEESERGLLDFDCEDENHRAIDAGYKLYSHIIMENWNE